MRRTIPVVGTTCGTLALLAAFHSHPAGSAATAGPAATGTSLPQDDSPAPPSTGAPVTTPATSPTTVAGANRTVSGAAERNPYGTVQVQVVLSGRQIVDVQALRLPTDRARSAQISSVAGPLLRQEALRAQSAAIDVVSGATYTSESYAASLQGALDAGGR